MSNHRLSVACFAVHCKVPPVPAQRLRARNCSTTHHAVVLVISTYHLRFQARAWPTSLTPLRGCLICSGAQSRRVLGFSWIQGLYHNVRHDQALPLSAPRITYAMFMRLPAAAPTTCDAAELGCSPQAGMLSHWRRCGRCPATNLVNDSGAAGARLKVGPVAMS